MEGIYYAHKQNGIWMHIHKQPELTAALGNGHIYPVYVRSGRPRQYAQYWAWEPTDGESLRHFVLNRLILEVAFPQGLEAAIRDGLGKPVCVTIETLSTV